VHTPEELGKNVLPMMASSLPSLLVLPACCARLPLRWKLDSQLQTLHQLDRIALCFYAARLMRVVTLRFDAHDGQEPAGFADRGDEPALLIFRKRMAEQKSVPEFALIMPRAPRTV